MDTFMTVIYWAAGVFMVLLLWQCFFHQWRYIRRKRQWRRDLSEMRTPKQWWGQR